MKKRLITKIFIALTLLCYVHHSNAQSGKIEWSTIMKKPAFESSLLLFNLNSDGFLGFSQDRKQYFIHTFDSKMHPLSKQASDVPEVKGQKIYVSGVFKFNDTTLTLFAYRYDKQADLAILYAGKVDLLGKIVEPFKNITSVNTVDPALSDIFKFKVNEDSTSILVYNIAVLKNNKKSGRMDVKVLSLDLDVIWEREITFTSKFEDFDIESILLTKENKLYYLFKESIDGHRFFSRYSYTLFGYNVKSKIQETKLEVPNYDICGLAFTIDEAGNFILGGVYKESKLLEPKGMFYIKIEPSVHNKFTLKTDEFKDEALLKIVNKGSPKNRSLFENGYEIKDILLQPDGSAIFIAECTITEEIKKEKGPEAVKINRELLVTKYYKSGNQAWVIPISKFERNTYSPMVSYFLATKGSSIFIVHNDASVTVKEINLEKGKITNSYAEKKFDYAIMPYFGLMINENTIVLPVASKLTKNIFCKITLQ